MTGNSTSSLMSFFNLRSTVTLVSQRVWLILPS